MSISAEGNNLYTLEDQKQQQEQRTAVQIQHFPTAQVTSSLNPLTQGTTYTLVPTSLAGTISQPASLAKQKRKQVKNACGK